MRIPNEAMQWLPAPRGRATPNQTTGITQSHSRVELLPSATPSSSLSSGPHWPGSSLDPIIFLPRPLRAKQAQLFPEAAVEARARQLGEPDDVRLEPDLLVGSR